MLLRLIWESVTPLCMNYTFGYLSLFLVPRFSNSKYIGNIAAMQCLPTHQKPKLE